MSDKQPYAPPKANLSSTEGVPTAGWTLRLFSPCALLLAALYVGWWAVTGGGLIWLAVSAALLMLGIGLLMRARWAKYLLYLAAGGISMLWIGMIALLALAGSLDNNLPQMLISLIPGLLLLLVCGVSVLSTKRAYT